MKKKAYNAPQMEVMNISGQTMMAISGVTSNVFDGYDGTQNPTGGGRANKRRNWDNTGW